LKNRWFEVGREVKERPKEPPDIFNQIRQITEVGIQQVEKKKQEKIKATDKNKKPNL
jgi:hypothetical protein